MGWQTESPPEVFKEEKYIGGGSHTQTVKKPDNLWTAKNALCLCRMDIQSHQPSCGRSSQKLQGLMWPLGGKSSGEFVKSQLLNCNFLEQRRLLQFRSHPVEKTVAQRCEFRGSPAYNSWPKGGSQREERLRGTQGPSHYVGHKQRFSACLPPPPPSTQNPHTPNIHFWCSKKSAKLRCDF